ncbi:MAG: EamA family transporter RarD [Ruminococcaceae bacterium]|nr:EamA family transporter RarD [Oscillospiraceae bacterium]
MKKGAIYVLMCYILWGVLPIFWKQLGGIDSFYILSLRIVWSLIFCGLILAAKGELHKIKEALSDKKERNMLLLSSIMVTINWGVYIFAVMSGKVLESSIAYFINPIFAVVLGFVIYKEKLTKLQWLSVLIAFIGVMIPIVIYGTIPYYALAIAVSFAFYGAAKKRVKADSVTSVFMETLYMAPIALMFILFKEFTGTGYITNVSTYQLILFPIAGVVTSVPLLLFAKGMKDTSLTLSGILMYINPTLQMLVGVLLYNETFTKTNLVMFMFVLAAVIIFVANNLIEAKKLKPNGK